MGINIDKDSATSYILRLDKKKVTPSILSDICCSHVLLVEGEDDRFFFEHLIKHIYEDTSNSEILTETVQFFISKGKTRFKELIKSIAKTKNSSNIRKLALIRDIDNEDVDSDLLPKLKSYFTDIDEIDFTLPLDNPTEFPSGAVSVGFFFLPDNKSSGKLETLCLQAIKNDPKYVDINRCIKAFLECASELNITLDLEKTEVKAFCSLFADIRYIGGAVQRNLINFNSEVFQELKEFTLKFLEKH